MVVKVAETLGKSIEEVMQFSVLELTMWSAYFKMKHDEERKVLNDGRSGAPRIRRSR